MSALAYAGSCLLAVALCAGAVVLLRVLITGLARFHTAGLAAIRHNTRSAR